MALMMVFSSTPKERYRAEAYRLGFDFYQTDNIYQFLRYAKEAEPALVVMQFQDGFNNDDFMMYEIKKALCKNNVCPRILLNQPIDFSGEVFFENTNFDGAIDDTFLD